MPYSPRLFARALFRRIFRVSPRDAGSPARFRRIACAAIGCVLALTAGAVFALPPMLPLQERYELADAVVAARISDVRSEPFSSISRTASLRVSVEERIKGEVPERFSLNFLVFPETFESHMREPVAPGRYVIFLRRVQVTDSGGRRGEALTPIDPRPFAFYPLAEDADLPEFE